MDRHAAIIRIDYELLLDILQFRGGKIHRVYTRGEQWNTRDISLVIEHPDLPKVEENCYLTEIIPTYTREYSAFGNLIDIKRNMKNG